MRRFVVEQEQVKYSFIADGNQLTHPGEAANSVTVHECAQGQFRLTLGGKSVIAHYVKNGQKLDLLIQGFYYKIVQTEFAVANAAADKILRIRAEIPGRIVRIFAQVGHTYAEGTVLMTHEAMKMELSIKAPRTLTVSEILVAEGSQVDADELLIKFDEN